MESSQPSGVTTPETIGTTIALDEVIGRSRNGAIILRSLVVYNTSLTVNVEILRAPAVIDGDWLAVANVFRPDEDTPRLDLKLLYGDGGETRLEATEGRGDGGIVKVGYSTRLDPARIPTGLKVVWLDDFESTVELPTGRMHDASTEAVSIW